MSIQNLVIIEAEWSATGVIALHGHNAAECLDKAAAAGGVGGAPLCQMQFLFWSEKTKNDHVIDREMSY